MRIDISNASIINTPEIHIHDNILINIEFDKQKDHIELFTFTSDSKECVLGFDGVVYFEVTACDFWGPSLSICDFEYVKHNESCAIPRLTNKLKEQGDCGFGKMINLDKLIETRITLCSGDQLTIVCEVIEINKV